MSKLLILLLQCRQHLKWEGATSKTLGAAWKKSPAEPQFIFKETDEQHNTNPETATAPGDSVNCLCKFPPMLTSSFTINSDFCHIFIQESLLWMVNTWGRFNSHIGLAGHSIPNNHMIYSYICEMKQSNVFLSAVSYSNTIRTLCAVHIEIASSQTYSYIVDGHADRSMVINLLCGNGLGLVGQKDSQQQQKPLVAVHHTCREECITYSIVSALKALRQCLVWKHYAFYFRDTYMWCMWWSWVQSCT